jgi:hypothetical protein
VYLKENKPNYTLQELPPAFKGHPVHKSGYVPRFGYLTYLPPPFLSRQNRGGGQFVEAEVKLKNESFGYGNWLQLGSLHCRIVSIATEITIA